MQLNQQYIQYLLKGETDLISSQNLAQLELVDVITGSDKSLQQLIFSGEKFRQDNPESSFYSGVVISPDSSTQEVENIIEALERFEFILFNVSDTGAQIDILKKYAPMAKICLTNP
jgi:hypothetical protein